MKYPFTPFSCFEVHVGEKSCAAHIHDIHEFFVCTDDNGTQFAGRTAIPQHRAEMFCFPAGMPHYCSGTPRARAGGYVIMVPDFMFPPETYGDRETHLTLQRVIHLALNGQNPLPLQKKTAQRILSLTEQMVKEFCDKPPGYQAASRLLLQHVFLDIMRDPEVVAEIGLRSRSTYRDEQMARVLRFIDAHFMETITVGQVAKMAGMSRSQFHAIFRQVTGCTLIVYTTRIRIQTAQRLLRETNSPIIQIALDCGFPSLSRFYDAFKSITGKTPRQARAD